MNGESANKPAGTFTIDFTKCSAQAKELCELDVDYRQQAEQLWALLSECPGPRQLQKMGYGYLVALYYEMPKRANAANQIMSQEFQDLHFFCRYVGPRPTSKHSLHRLNNEIGYCIGNVEWADKRKQAEVRRTAQHHQYLSRKLTDRQVAELITSKVRPISSGAIKKRRQRLKKRGLGAMEITRSIFEEVGLPYTTSLDPLEAWDFLAEFHCRLSKLYPNLRGPRETRISYFRRWLSQKIEEFESNANNPMTSELWKKYLTGLLTDYRCKLNEINMEIECRHNEKVGKLVDEGLAPFSYAMKPLPQPPVLQPVAQEPVASYDAAPEPERDRKGRTREEFEDHIRAVEQMMVELGKGLPPMTDVDMDKSWKRNCR